MATHVLSLSVTGRKEYKDCRIKTGKLPTSGITSSSREYSTEVVQYATGSSQGVEVGEVGEGSLTR